MSDYLKDLLLDQTLAGSVYISAHITSPLDDASGAELSGDGYARVQVTDGFSAASGGTSDNDAAITWPDANGGDWGTISHIGIWDASSNGNLFLHEALNTSKDIDDGDTLEIAAGDLDVAFA
jgi:hypothetical protein